MIVFLFWVLRSCEAMPLTVAKSDKGARKSPGERKMEESLLLLYEQALGLCAVGELFTYLPALNTYY